MQPREPASGRGDQLPSRSGQSVTRVGADCWLPVSGPTKVSVSEAESYPSRGSRVTREKGVTRPDDASPRNARRIEPKRSGPSLHERTRRRRRNSAAGCVDHADKLRTVENDARR